MKEYGVTELIDLDHEHPSEYIYVKAKSRREALKQFKVQAAGRPGGPDRYHIEF